MQSRKAATQLLAHLLFATKTKKLQPLPEPECEYGVSKAQEVKKCVHAPIGKAKDRGEQKLKAQTLRAAIGGRPHLGVHSQESVRGYANRYWSDVANPEAGVCKVEATAV